MRLNTHLSESMARMRLWLIGLIVLSTLLFVVGILAERNSEASHSDTPVIAQATATAASGSAESQEEGAEGTHSESDEGTEESTHTEEGTEATETHADNETLLGIDIENPLVITAIVKSWLALIGGLFVLGRAGFVLVAVIAILSATFDLNEAFYKIGSANTGIAILAVLVAVSHLGVAILTIWALRGRTIQSGKMMT